MGVERLHKLFSSPDLLDCMFQLRSHWNSRLLWEVSWSLCLYRDWLFLIPLYILYVLKMNKIFFFGVFGCVCAWGLGGAHGKRGEVDFTLSLSCDVAFVGQLRNNPLKYNYHVVIIRHTKLRLRGQGSHMATYAEMYWTWFFFFLNLLENLILFWSHIWRVFGFNNWESGRYVC